MKPHKHAELIKAWADGATLQKKVLDDTGTHWIDIFRPIWHVDEVYRIKPEEKKPVVRWLWAVIEDEELPVWFCDGIYMSEKVADDRSADVHKIIKLEWSRTEFPE